MSETGPNRTLLWIHPLIRVKIDFSSSLGDGRVWKKCTISTNLKTCFRSIVLDNFWSSDIFFQIAARILAAGFPCRSSLACISARGGCVRISTFILLCSFLHPLLLKSPLSKALVPPNTGLLGFLRKISSTLSAILSQDPSGFVMMSFRTTSFSDPGPWERPMSARESTSILFKLFNCH